jgi:D-sedoheptulose 7-phosphate isomerase
MLEQRIQQHFFESADLKYQSAEVLSRPIAEAASALVGCITAGGKVLVCGGRRSVAAARQLATDLIGQFERERPGLAAIGLALDGAVLAGPAEGPDYTSVFAQQVQALGQPGDVLVVVSATGESSVVLAAVDAARAKDMTIVALTGRGGGALVRRLSDTDVNVCVPHDRVSRIREVHQLVLHCLCDAVDLQLLGEQDSA